MDTLEPDLAVIGGGSAGLSVAAGAVQMGASVVLIEGGKMGGDCLNYGCVPSKALLAAGKAAHAMTAGAPFGVAPVAPQVDFGKVKDHVEAVIAGIAPHDSVERFEGLGVTVLQGWAKFASPDALEVTGEDGVRRVKARRIVIATGSRAWAPPIPGLSDVPYHTNETIFALRDKPSRLLILGGGPIGMEMAQAHRRLGCEVTVIEGAKALGRDDPEIAAIALERLRAEGIEIVEGAPVAKAAVLDGGGVALETKDGRRFEGSHLLVAAGRRANLDGLDLPAGKVEKTPGGIKADEGLRSVSNRRVYAAGDAAGGLQFTHVAGWHAGLVIRNALFRMPVKASTGAIPWATYTDPEIAQVGLTEAEARTAHGDKIEVLRFKYEENDRARAELATDGLVKVIVLKGRPIGASIVGRHAGELISLWALAISAKLKIGQVAGFVAPYPTYSELSKRAAGQYYVPRLFQSGTVKRMVKSLAKLG
ncbi:MAG: FAD-dependent oxidoreductase [Pseudomonadota bacterium]